MPITILVVDDEEDVLDLFQRQFRKELRRGEYVLYFANSGEEALNALSSNLEPGVMLILSDINMPGMSGIDLLKKSKGLYPELPVAMITAYGDEESRSKALAAGATDYLTKPLDFGELRLRLSRMIDGTD